jgi:filamentous hemagglutinin
VVCPLLLRRYQYSISELADAEAGGWSQYNKFRVDQRSNADSGWKWPSNAGFLGHIEESRVSPGTLLDRYGNERGSFLSPVGVSYAQRALAPGTRAEDYHTYEVLKPFPIKEGKIAPAFDQPGLGTQILPNFERRTNVQWLRENGYIREVKGEP